jgi:hypothetical protein
MAVATCFPRAAPPHFNPDSRRSSTRSQRKTRLNNFMPTSGESHSVISLAKVRMARTRMTFTKSSRFGQRRTGIADPTWISVVSGTKSLGFGHSLRPILRVSPAHGDFVTALPQPVHCPGSCRQPLENNQIVGAVCERQDFAERDIRPGNW